MYSSLEFYDLDSEVCLTIIERDDGRQRSVVQLVRILCFKWILRHHILSRFPLKMICSTIFYNENCNLKMLFGISQRSFHFKFIIFDDSKKNLFVVPFPTSISFFNKFFFCLRNNNPIERKITGTLTKQHL